MIGPLDIREIVFCYEHTQAIVLYVGDDCPCCKTESDLHCMQDKLDDVVATIENLRSGEQR